jgi:hypothetical protein
VVVCTEIIIGAVKSGRIRWARHIEQMENKKNAYIILVGYAETKRILRLPACW